ncbi:MAG: hypothetical protein ABI211_03470 [Vicinamibacterales bacterium]
MTRLLIVVAAAALAASGCGKSEQQKQAEEAAKHIEAAAKEISKAAESAGKENAQAANDAAKGFEAMAKGFGAMVSGAAGDGKVVEPVSFRDLQALFPAIDGWERSKPTGEKVSAPFKYSNAEVTYRKGDARIELKLADAGFNQLFFAPFAMLMQAGYEKETQDGYEKSIKISGQPGFEKWNTERQDGELTAMVGKRFLLSVEGRHIDDIKLLHDVVGKIDLAKLAGLQ